MKFKVLQWNINGGYVRSAESDPSEDSSYAENDLNYFIAKIKEHNPDIVLLQESHSGKGLSYGDIFAKELGIKYYADHPYAPSHMGENQKLTHTILSRFPFEDLGLKLFKNPHLDVFSGGKLHKKASHDKGISTFRVDFGADRPVTIQTLHMLPFRRCNIDPFDDSLLEVRRSVAEGVYDGTPMVLAGDFNYDNASVKALIPTAFKNGLEECVFGIETTPDGRIYDHVLYRGLKVGSFRVDSDVLADHYPIIVEFEL